MRSRTPEIKATLVPLWCNSDEWDGPEKPIAVFEWAWSQQRNLLVRVRLLHGWTGWAYPWTWDSAEQKHDYETMRFEQMKQRIKELWKEN